MAKVIVYHSYYGCDTGCCGHRIEVDGEELNGSHFVFDHPWHASETFREWAEDLVRLEMGEEHVKDLDWENCLVIDD